jgi:hypothetical protein
VTITASSSNPISKRAVKIVFWRNAFPQKGQGALQANERGFFAHAVPNAFPAAVIEAVTEIVHETRNAGGKARKKLHATPSEQLRPQFDRETRKRRSIFFLRFLVDGLVFMSNTSRMAETSKKDSTNELPMFNIEEAIQIVTTIHEKALENAAMPDVAKGCGYANPTSTPFYRRIVAARLFRFLNAPKAELTRLALDYLKPDTDDARQSALTQAIMGIQVYADIVNQHVGKRLNVELIANKLEKDDNFGISKVCAKACAVAFAESLKFAGFIRPDNTVGIPAWQPPSENVAAPTSVEPPKPKKSPEKEWEADDDSQVQTLYLDNKRRRKIIIKAPFTVTTEELERIRAWLGFQLIVEDTTAAPTE